MTTATLEHTTKPAERRLDRFRLALLAPLVGWMVVAMLHPAANPGTVYDDLHDQVGRWIGVHLAQLVLTLGLGAVAWTLVQGRSGVWARATRWAVPTFMVFFAVFDSVAGIGTGLAVHHANSLSGPAQESAAGTVEYLAVNNVAGDLSPIGFISGLALVLMVVGCAMTFRSLGAARGVWIPMLGGLLLNFHAAGVIPVAGLVAFSYAIVRADQSGLILRDR